MFDKLLEYPDLGEAGKAIAHLWKGSISYSKKNYHEALLDFGEAIKLNPNYYRAYWYTGMSHQELGSNQAAIEAFLRAEELTSSACNEAAACSGCTVLVGSARLRSKQYERALQDFTRALEKTPESVDALANRAQTYFILKNLPSALQDIDKAIRLNAKEPNLFYLRAQIYYALNKSDDAIEDANSLLKLLPEDPTRQLLLVSAKA
jgi:tetratricopeptide (TPR) repeat protein